MAIADYGSTLKPGYNPEALQLPSVAACIAEDANRPWALIKEVLEGSPAWDAGLEPNMVICEVSQTPLRDMIDWIWESGEAELLLAGFDLEGDWFSVTLERELGEDWGITFTDCIFDGLRTCCNACQFCFMHQLPQGMRDSLYLRDDDYRLSFLQGNFVTLTNVSACDLERILAYRISPLHVSLHAIQEDVRKALMGPRSMRGLEVFEEYLSQGLEAHVQLVLCPGINDGDVLRETLDWCLGQSGILSIGLVPLGFTKHQNLFVSSYENPEDALAIINIAGEYNELAQKLYGENRVFPADEFYLNAYPDFDGMRQLLPSSEWYEDFPQFQDGIGFVRSFIDDLSSDQGAIEELRKAAAISEKEKPVLVCGVAFEKFALAEFKRLGLLSCITPLVVSNNYFGGNVDVLGLLCAEDVAEAWCKGAFFNVPVMLPRVMFNNDMLTLDGMSAADLNDSLGGCCSVVSFEAKELLKYLLNYYVSA